MRAALVVALLGVLALATGCDDGGPRTYTVAASAGAALLEPGDHLRIDLGENDPAADSAWFLLKDPDPTVLTDNGSDFESECPGNGQACRGRYYWDFTAAGSGFEALAFQQCLHGVCRPPASSAASPSRSTCECGERQDAVHAVKPPSPSPRSSLPPGPSTIDADAQSRSRRAASMAQ